MRIFDIWRPNNRSTHRHNRTDGLKLVFALALVIGASIGQGQPAPDTILLPDSLGPLRPGYHLAFGSSTNNIYVASESSDIMVVDGNTFQRIERINTGTPVGGALLVSQHNRLYCSYPMQGRIGVIDCATNSIVGSIQVGTRPTLLCYSSGSDKLYCCDTVDNTVTVIGCAADTVVEVIAVGDSLTAMAYDPTTAKVYVATGSAVLAISCATDSVVATISAVKAAIGLCVNQRRQKLYAVVRPRKDTVFVIGTTTDSVVARMQCYGTFAPEPACNEVTDRLYAMADAGGAVYVMEFDCTRDTWVRSRSVGDYISTVGLFCDTVRNRLYYLYKEDDRGFLLVLDCATLNFISETQVEDHPDVLEADPARNRVMCAGVRWEGVLTVFDYKHDSLDAIGFVPLCGWQRELCHNPAAGKLYYRWGDGGGGVAVVEEQTNRVVAQIVLPQKYGYAGGACSRTSNKMYFEVASGLAVVDGAGDSLLKLINLDGSGSIPFWYTDSNKLYCFVNAGPRWYIAVLDCYTDSVVREIEAYHGGVGTFMLLNESLLLGARADGLTLIDCREDSVLVDTTTPGNIYAVAHSGNDKVYIVHHYTYDRLEVLDASSLSLRTTIGWSYGGTDPFLVCSDSTDKLYWFARDISTTEPDSVLAIDTRSDSVVARLGAGFMQQQGCLDHSGRYIFNPNPENIYYPHPVHNSLIIYDTQSDSVAAVYENLPNWPVTAISSPERRCIYVGCTDVILVYSDVPPGVAESMNDERGVMNTRAASIVRGILFLPGANSLKPQAASLVNVSGRRVMALRPGANDVRALPPGVYFVRPEPSAVSDQSSAVTKVVIAR
jgi:DNA-binding beta-propeller fold protein YncE